MNSLALEQQLCVGFREEGAFYLQALALAQTWTPGEDVTAALATISQLLTQVAEVETRLAPLKEEWRQSGRQPGTALAQVLAEVAGLIQQLQTHIHHALQQTQDRQRLLAPEVDTLIRRRHMQKAYGAARESVY